MSGKTSQIIGVSIVWPIVCSGADQRKHQSSASLAFVREIHRWPVDSPHKGPVTRNMFPLDDVIMWWSILQFAEIGFAVSVLFTLSLTVASFCLPPRPPWEFLPISTSGCPANNNTMDSLTGPMTSPASHYMRSTTLNSVTISGDEAGLDMSGWVIHNDKIPWYFNCLLWIRIENTHLSYISIMLCPLPEYIYIYIYIIC